MSNNKKAEEADFVYAGRIEFDSEDTPFDPLEIEKARYKKGILPKLKEIEEEIKKDKPEETSDEELKEFILKTKKNHREIKFEYETGDIYPKEIPFPDIISIQYPEPHVLITDLYDSPQDWYQIKSIIQSFAEESYLSYEMGFWFASISSAINCCEYILKYELFRKLNKEDKKKLSELLSDRWFGLGKISKNHLSELNISNLKKDLDYLNDVRVAIYHANSERAKRVSEEGELEFEKSAPITDPHIQPIISFRIYTIMMKLISHYYNKKKALEYAKEGIEDWKNKRNLSGEDLKDD